MSTLVWFRQDLRTADNPALFEAAKNGPVLPVFIHEDPQQTGDPYPLGGASKWWLHHSLSALQQRLPGLVILKGDARFLLPQIARQAEVSNVCWNRCYEPHAIERDTEIKALLRSDGFNVESFKASLLFEPWELTNKAGGPFKVYSPFWKTAQQLDVKAPLPEPENIEYVAYSEGEPLECLGLLPQNPNWAEGWEDLWSPGELGAKERLEAFLEADLEGYGTLRNRPDLPNVSRLSPHLHIGDISPRQIWFETQKTMNEAPDLGKDGQKFLSEIAWREFSYHLLYHFPELPKSNWRPTFDAYPWREVPDDLERWQKGRTGYPIVDAGMRELWKTGYMHNRVRMIVASFLVKHLRLHWHHGEAWFRDTLLDADLANNSASWQWVTGSGADAAPYFRIFNPITQGQKFDPEGVYVRRWVPELCDLETPYLFEPFNAPEAALERAGIVLGIDYPSPIVDHAAARQAALEGYEAVKLAGQNAA
ncbi:deoxyribodipyrimidine photo-lyase [uncultured Roseibium sp.]|uniref:cryptochrome/photolyase family protein n=1 Tax=uncultured Roseibium sp. TaxID=1936171 RepID=UPI002603E3DC|nr:deoxyribodipyrimidine photo-lyase [uncultured Roseibium sp.]